MNQCILYYCLLCQILGGTNLFSEYFNIGRIISVSNNDKNNRLCQILEVLGSGEYARVYKVFDFISKKIYAMKVQTNDKTGNIEIEEAIYKNLSSEYLLKYYDLYNYRHFVIMFLEYSSTTLEEFLKTSIGLNEKIGVTKNIILALRFLHNNGIIHNDIKANNIMVTKNLKCKIFDFGISCYEKDPIKIFSNSMDSTNPCFSYISPEIRCCYRYNRYSDIWSLGALVHYIFLNEFYNGKIMNSNTILANFLQVMLKFSSFARPSTDLLIYHQIFDSLYIFINNLMALKNFYIILPDNIVFIKKNNYFEIKYRNFSVSLIYISDIESRNIVDDRMRTLIQKRYPYFFRNTSGNRFLFSEYRFYMISIDRGIYFSIVELEFYSLNMLENIAKFCQEKILGIETQNVLNYRTWVKILFQELQSTKRLKNSRENNTLYFKFSIEKETWKNSKCESFSRENNLRRNKNLNMHKQIAQSVIISNENKYFYELNKNSATNTDADITNPIFQNEEFQKYDKNPAESRSFRSKKRSRFLSFLCLR